MLDPDAQGEQAEAEEYLRAELAEGTRPATEVEGPAMRRFSRATLRRAKKAVGVVSERQGFGNQGRWYWHLPDSGEDGTAIDAHVPLSAYAHEQHEHLCASPHGKRDCDPIETVQAPIDAHSQLMSTYGGNMVDAAPSDLAASAAEEIEIERLRARLPNSDVTSTTGQAMASQRGLIG